MSTLSSLSTTDNILSVVTEPNPTGCRWITIGHGDVDCTELDFRTICSYFRSCSQHGVVVMETGTELGHKHIHVACIIPQMPKQWLRDLYKKLGWEGKRQPKWLQLHNKNWSATYTWQNIVGGYCCKETDAPRDVWGLTRDYLTAGKVAYTGHADAKRDKLELNPSNVIRILSVTGRQRGLSTAKEALQACLDQGYSVWKLGGKLRWSLVEVDVQNKLRKRKPKAEDLIREFEHRW